MCLTRNTMKSPGGDNGARNILANPFTGCTDRQSRFKKWVQSADDTDPFKNRSSTRVTRLSTSLVFRRGTPLSTG